MIKRFQILYFTLSRKNCRFIGPKGSEWYVRNWFQALVERRGTPWLTFRAVVQEVSDQINQVYARQQN